MKLQPMKPFTSNEMTTYWCVWYVCVKCFQRATVLIYIHSTGYIHKGKSTDTNLYRFLADVENSCSVFVNRVVLNTV